MATSIDTLLKFVLPYLPGCPENLAIDALRSAAVRLCEDSLIWRYNITPIDVVTGTDEYTINPPSKSSIIAPITIQYDGQDVPLPIRTEEWLDIHDSGWRLGKDGQPTAVVMLAPEIIKLNRKPEKDITGGLVPRVALKPTDSADTIDDILATHWKKALRFGALNELYEIPGKKWSDAERAEHYGNLFNFEVQRARAVANKGFSRSDIAVKMRRWV